MNTWSMRTVFVLMISCLSLSPASAENNTISSSSRDSTDLNQRSGDGYDIILQAWHWNLYKNRLFDKNGNGKLDKDIGEYIVMARDVGNVEGAKYGTMSSPYVSWYKVLENRANEFTKDGFTVIYMPPPWKDTSGWIKYDEGGNIVLFGGGEGYFWRDAFVGNDVPETNYGTSQQLKDSVSALSNNGLRIIYDIVPNHRADRWESPSGWAPNGNIWGDKINTSCDSDELPDGGTFLSGDADLNIQNAVVHNYILKAMSILSNSDYKASGWRWDLPWGWHACHTDKWMDETQIKEYFSMGEYWPGSPNSDNDPNIQRAWDAGYRLGGRGSWGDRMCYWVDRAQSPVQDFILKKLINTGNAASLREWSLNKDDTYKKHAITFVGTHDTDKSPQINVWGHNYYGQNMWPCPDDFKLKAYAYILSMPGIPQVYWPDIYDSDMGQNIKSMIAVRKASRVRSDSMFVVKGLDGFAAIIKDGPSEANNDVLAVSIESSWSPGNGWQVAAHGPGYTLWTVAR